MSRTNVCPMGVLDAPSGGLSPHAYVTAVSFHECRRCHCLPPLTGIRAVVIIQKMLFEIVSALIRDCRMY